MNKLINHKDKFYIKSDKGYKEVLATTDESLEIMMSNPAALDAGIKTMNLPRPSNEFLEAFVKAEGKITELLVETNAEFYADSEPFATKASRDSYVQETGASHSCWTKNLGLKVSPDNTITIKPVQEKTSWNRDEVIALVKDAMITGVNIRDRNLTFNDIRDKWIEENLK